MQSNWLILTIISGLSSVIFNTLNRETLKKGHDSTVYSWLFEVIRFLFFAALIPFDHYLVCSSQNTLILIALGFTELIAIYLYMKMHAHTELSISSIIVRLRVILVPLVAFIFLGERLSTLQYFGVTAVFAGCLVVTGMKHIRSTKGVWYALGFVLVNSVSNVLMKYASGIASVSIVSAAFSFPSAVLIPVIMQSAHSRIHLHFKPIFKQTLLAAGFNIVTMFTMVMAYRTSSVSQVNSVFQAITSLAVVVGIFALNERDHKWLKLLGAALTTLGIILLV